MIVHEDGTIQIDDYGKNRPDLSMLGIIDDLWTDRQRCNQYRRSECDAYFLKGSELNLQTKYHQDNYIFVIDGDYNKSKSTFDLRGNSHLLCVYEFWGHHMVILTHNHFIYYKICQAYPNNIQGIIYFIIEK